MTHTAPTLSFQVQLQDTTGLGLQALSEQLLRVLSTAGFAAITVSENPQQAHDREASAATERLDAVHEKLALPDDALDELMHDSGDDEMAANANNGGPSAQIRFLMDNGWNETELKERMYDIWNDLHEGQRYVTGWVSSEDGTLETPIDASGYLWAASPELLTRVVQQGGHGDSTVPLAEAYRGFDPEVDAIFAYTGALNHFGRREIGGIQVTIDSADLLQAVRGRASDSQVFAPLAARLAHLTPVTVSPAELKAALKDQTPGDDAPR